MGCGAPTIVWFLVARAVKLRCHYATHDTDCHLVMQWMFSYIISCSALEVTFHSDEKRFFSIDKYTNICKIQYTFFFQIDLPTNTFLLASQLPNAQIRGGATHSLRVYGEAPRFRPPFLQFRDRVPILLTLCFQAGQSY